MQCMCVYVCVWMEGGRGVDTRQPFVYTTAAVGFTATLQHMHSFKASHSHMVNLMVLGCATSIGAARV